MKSLKKIAQKLLSGILAAAMLVSMLPATTLTVAADEGEASYLEIKLDKDTLVSGQDEVLLSFTPEESGTYKIYSFDRGDYDPYVTLYDSDKNFLANDDDSNGDRNFLLRYELEAGVQYLFGVRNYYNGSFEYAVRLTKIQTAEVTFHHNRAESEAWYYDENGQKVQTIVSHKEKDAYLQLEGYEQPRTDLETIVYVGYSADPDAEQPDNNIFISGDTDLYAVWYQKYPVTFHINHDSAYWEMWNDETETYEHIYEITDYRVLDTYVSEWEYQPEPDSYDSSEVKFLGWSTDPNAITNDTSIVVTGSMDLYAVWSYPCTVTYIANGGYFETYVTDPDTGEETVEKEDSRSFDLWTGENFEYQDIKHDSKFAQFNGWFSQAEGGTQYSEQSIIEGDMTVYAQWTLSEQIPLILDTENEIWPENSDDYYTFTPAESGRYRLSLYNGNYENDTIWVYDSDLNQINWFDVYIGEDLESRWIQDIDLEADETYYFRFRSYYDEPLEQHFTLYFELIPMVDVTFHVDSGLAYFDYDSSVLSKTVKVEENSDIRYYRNFSTLTYDTSVLELYGWSVNEGADEPDEELIAVQGLEVYSVWNQLIPITFDANGGYFDGNSEITTWTYGFHAEDNLWWNNNLYNDDGYQLAGWAADPDAEAAEIEPGYSYRAADVPSVLYAVWGVEASIEYDANGGYFWNESTLTTTDYTVTRRHFHPESYEYAIYHSDIRNTFAGWYDEPEGGNKLTADTIITGDMTVYAHWDEIETIKLELDTEYVLDSVDAGKYLEFTATEDSIYRISLYNTSAEHTHITMGDTIANWNYSTSGWPGQSRDDALTLQRMVPAGITQYIRVYEYYTNPLEYGTVYLEKLPTTRVTLHANHEDAYYEEFNSSTGDYDHVETYFTYQQTGIQVGRYDFNRPYMDNADVAFAGWATSADATEAEETITVTGTEMDLYAVWKKSYTVTFDVNRSIDEAWFEIWDSEQAEYIRNSVSTRTYAEGSRFWWDNSPSYDSSKIDLKGWSVDPHANEAEYITVTGDMTVYAVWKEVYPVTFHANDENAWYIDYNNDNRHTDTSISYFDEGSTLYRWTNQPEYSGNMDFLGWSVDPDATAPDSKIVINGPTDVYAVWKHYYPVTYNANGGYFVTHEWDSETSTSVEVKTDTITISVPEGDAFTYQTVWNDNIFSSVEGWYDAATGGTMITSDTVVTGPMTVYAHWTTIESGTLIADEVGDAVSEDDAAGKAIFTFTPSEDGKYMFQSADALGFRPVAVLYDDDNNVIAETNGSLDNFSMTADLQAGKTYYLVLTNQKGGAFNYHILVSKVETATITFDLVKDGAYFILSDGSHTDEYSVQDIIGQNFYPNAVPPVGSDSDEFVFAGWTKDINTENTIYFIPVRGDTTLYAVWKEKVTVTFHANNDAADVGWNRDGSFVKELSAGYAQGATISRYANTPSYDSSLRNFLGWSVNPTATTPDSTIYANSDMDLYAVWGRSGGSTSFEDAIPIHEGETKHAESDGPSIIYSFVPEESGAYVIRSTNISSGDPYVILYSASGGVINSNDDGGEGVNFMLAYTLEAGKTYYYLVRSLSSGSPFSYDVSLFKAVTTSVTFDANREDAWFYVDGTKSSTRTQEYVLGTMLNSYDTPNIADDAGVAFAGWSTNPQATEPDNGIVITENLVLYAVWKETVKITFDVNCSVEDAFLWDYDDYGEISVAAVTRDYTLGTFIDNRSEYPNVRNTRLKFLGWAEDKDATEPDEVIVADREKTLYAVWSYKYVATFVANGGTIIRKGMDGGGVNRIQSMLVSSLSEFMDYYAARHPDPLMLFEGWYDAPEGGELHQSDEVLSGDVVLYAHYKRIEPIPLVLDEKTTVSGTVNGQVVYYSFTPSEDGVYLFSSDTKNVYIYGYLHDDEMAVIKYYETVPGDMITFAMGAELSAGRTYYLSVPVRSVDYDIVVTKSEYITITYDANRDDAWFNNEYTGYVNSRTFSRQVIKGIYPNASRPSTNNNNIMFEGWNTDPNATESMRIIEVPQSDTTYYAIWSNAVDVTFDANGGYFTNTGSNTYIARYSENTKIYFNYYFPEIMAHPDKTMVFAGWATTADAAEPDVIEGETPVKGLTTIYAVWKKGVLVTVDANGGYFKVNGNRTEIYEKYVLPGTTVRDFRNEEAFNDNDLKSWYGQYSFTRNGDPIANDTALTEDCTLYLVWRDLAEITFDAGDGTIQGKSSITQKYVIGAQLNSLGSQIQAKSNDPEKSFAGWSTTGQEKDIVKDLYVTSSVTLHAVYKTGYRVTVEANNSRYGLVVANVNETEYNAGEAFIWPKDVPLSDLNIYGLPEYGYIVIGFSTTPDESGMVDDDFTPSQDMTLYAIFVEGYTIMLSAGIGYFPSTGNWQTGKYVRKGEPIGYVETPVCDGMRFVGWRNAGADETIIEDISGIIPTGSMYFIAEWEKADEKIDISQAEVTLSGLEKPKAGMQWIAYDGTQKKPGVTVKLNGTTLKKDTDYTVAYSSNTNVGYALVTVTGTGKYTGSVSATFLITFKDVPMTHNFQKAVYWAVGEGIAAGYSGDRTGTFGVGDNITRGQVVMFLWRAAGQPKAKDLTTQSFTDVPTKSNFYKAIQWAVEQGITGGYTGARAGQFGPSDNCTRAQIAMFLWRYAGKPAPVGKTQTFTDVPVKSNFYKAIQWAYEQGITGGYTGARAGQFGPDDLCTRGQCVTFLYRLLGQ